MSKVKKSRSSRGSTAAPAPWSTDYDTLRRQHLFQNPPTKESAYPLLRDAVQFHNESYNAMFGRQRLIEKGLEDIGTKWHRDGELSSGQAGQKNDLRIRITGVRMGHAEVGGIKGAAKRLYPWECRERHISYRGRMTATLEYTINNGDPVEFEMDYGRVPIMVRVCFWATSLNGGGWPYRR